MPSRSSFTLTDKALGGRLVEMLTDMRQRKVPYAEMAILFRAEGITISSETLRRWVREQGVEPEPEQASA